MVLTWTAKSESRIIRVSISALLCDSDLSTPSRTEVSVTKVEERRKPTEVKIYLLEQFLASNFGEDVGDRQQHLEIFLAQEGCNESPYFAGEAGICVRLEFPAVSNVSLNKTAGPLPPAHGGPATTSRTSLRHFRDLASRRLRYLRRSPHVQEGGKVLPTAQAKTERDEPLWAPRA